MLHRLAAGDLYACRKLADDAEVDDHIIGFHVQQAVEKALKVALVLADSELPHTHDLELLAEQVKGAGTKVPDELSRTEQRGCVFARRREAPSSRPRLWEEILGGSSTSTRALIWREVCQVGVVDLSHFALLGVGCGVWSAGLVAVRRAVRDARSD